MAPEGSGAVHLQLRLPLIRRFFVGVLPVTALVAGSFLSIGWGSISTGAPDGC